MMDESILNGTPATLERCSGCNLRIIPVMPVDEHGVCIPYLIEVEAGEQFCECDSVWTDGPRTRLIMDPTGEQWTEQYEVPQRARQDVPDVFSQAFE